MQHKLFALIGYPLEHSFSKAYFEKKFAAEKLEKEIRAVNHAGLTCNDR